MLRELLVRAIATYTSYIRLYTENYATQGEGYTKTEREKKKALQFLYLVGRVINFYKLLYRYRMRIPMTNKIGSNKYIFPVVGVSPDFLMRLKVLHEEIAAIRQPTPM